MLHEADVPLNEAVWLLDARITDLARMRTDASALAAARGQKMQALSVRAKLALAMARLSPLPDERKVSILRTALVALEGVTDADGLLLRAEVVQAMAERGAARMEEALLVCGDAVRAFEGQNDEGGELGVQAYALLGDLCLDIVRGEGDGARIGELVAEGTKLGYERAMRVAEGIGSRVEAENLYNMACLIAIGMGKGCEVGYSEREVEEILKRAIDAGGISANDLHADTDLQHLRSRQWFERLVEYLQARARR